MTTNIQWYPGHMAKALREMKEMAKLIDLVIILLDARVPLSSQNPLFLESFANKRLLFVLTKIDKADESETAKWLNVLASEGKTVLAIDARSQIDAKKIIAKAAELMKEKRAKDALKGIKARPIKTMIVGIPNVGKSTLINALVRKKVANVGDKPGITKTQSWIRINEEMELLDTPGVLWPKLKTKNRHSFGDYRCHQRQHAAGNGSCSLCHCFPATILSGKFGALQNRCFLRTCGLFGTINETIGCKRRIRFRNASVKRFAKRPFGTFDV